MPRACVRATRTSVANMVSRYILKEGTPVDVPKRQRGHNKTKQHYILVPSVAGLSVMMNTLGNQPKLSEERYKEHLKAPSPIANSQILLATLTTVENFKIIGREGQNMARVIKEVIYIRVNNPTLNRNIGKYNMPHIWNKVLFAIPELKTKLIHLSTITSLP